MPQAIPVVIGAVASTAGQFAFTTMTISVMQAFAINLAIGGVLSFASAALTPKPKLPQLTPNFSSLGESAQARLVNIKQAIMSRQAIYGERRIAGNLVYASATNENEFLHLVLAVASHEIQSFESFQINEDTVSIDSDGFVTTAKYIEGSTKFIRIKTHLGTDTQTADSDLVSEDSNWTTNHRLRGIAYMYVRLKFSNDIFPNGIPNITCIVKGKKVFDLFCL